MRYPILDGTTNVVRFPVECRARPTLDLLRELAPDGRVVGLLADQAGIEMPDGVRDAADMMATSHIAETVAPHGPERSAQLAALLDAAVRPAILACQQAAEAMGVAQPARRGLERAEAESGYWMTPIEERAGWARQHSAEALVEAYAACQRAEGVVRAVSLARAGETWTPRDIDADLAAMFAACAAG